MLNFPEHHQGLDRDRRDVVSIADSRLVERRRKPSAGKRRESIKRPSSMVRRGIGGSRNINQQRQGNQRRTGKRTEEEEAEGEVGRVWHSGKTLPQ